MLINNYRLITINPKLFINIYQCYSFINALSESRSRHSSTQPNEHRGKNRFHRASRTRRCSCACRVQCLRVSLLYINSSNLGVNSSNFLCTVFPVFCSFPMYPIFFRPNGPRIRDPRIKLSLFPIFRAERSLIAPFSVTSSVPIFS